MGFVLMVLLGNKKTYNLLLKIYLNNRMCSLGAVEDEDHMLLVCPTHHDIRCKFGQH
jgi:hypothetical protein